MNMRPEPTAFIAVTPTMRVLIENVIEDLMLLLDTLDGDADLEPSLGAPEVSVPECVGYLGSIIRDTSQERWAGGYGDDLELDPGDDGLAEQRGHHRRTGQ